jgi:subtilisin family serine protease
MKNRNRVLIFAIAFALSVLLVSEAGAEYVEGEAIVLLRNPGGAKLANVGMSGAVQSYAARVAATNGGKVLKTYGALSEAADSVFAHIKSDNESTEELLSRLKSDSNVLSAMPNYIGHLMKTPNDPEYDKLWGIKAINAPGAWDSTTGSEAVYVAVIDSGVDLDHEDLKGNIDVERSRGFVTGDTSVTDAHGHGTHVSGTIGAVGDNGIGVVGVNWKIKIIMAKVADANGDLSVDAELDGVNYVTELMDSVNIKAVNMSYGGWYPKETGEPGMPYYEAYKAMSGKNKAVLVMAAGNEGREVGAPNPEELVYEDDEVIAPKGYYTYPLSLLGLDNTIVVGAVDESLGAAYFSNWSDQLVDVVAPGMDILSTWPVSGDVKYRLVTGTSMAAPHVTGAAALAAAQNPDWNASQIKNALLYTANGNVNPTSGITFKDELQNTSKMSRFGLIDVSEAIAYNQDSYVPAQSVLSISVKGEPVGADKSITIKRGQSVALSASISPSNATDKGLEWTSDNPEVAFVTGSGVLTAAAPGSATITARPLRGGETVSLPVYVTKNSGGGCSVGFGLPLLLVIAGLVFAMIGSIRVSANESRKGGDFCA